MNDQPLPTPAEMQEEDLDPPPADLCLPKPRYPGEPPPEWLVRKIEEGIADAKAGRTVPVEEVLREMDAAIREMTARRDGAPRP